jgi:hypothetical protein
MPSLEGSESPGASATPETAATAGVPVAIAALGTEPKGFLELPAQAPASDEVRQNRDERRAADLVERNDQLAEPAPKREKIEKTAEYAGMADEQPWWGRLLGRIQTRRGRAARGCEKGCRGLT